MASRIFFLGITAFWLVMNILLYRSQWGGHAGFGDSVPVEGVWNKILTAPDNSTLDIFNHDEMIGLGRWEVGAADSPLISSKILAQDYRPGRVLPKLSGYGLSFEGSGILNETNHFKFQCSLALDTNKVWQEFKLRVNIRPQQWEIHGFAAQQAVSLNIKDDTGEWEKTISFSELQDPQGLLAEFGDPITLGLLGLNRNLLNGTGPGMRWEAREDRINFGKSNLRVYRLESLFMGKKIDVVVSRIGEILRVDLPFAVSLRNQALSPPNN